jgi:cell division protein FtsI (penicillin-binding protein 3)
MGKRMQYRKLVWLTTLAALAMVGLSVRLIDLQVLRHDDLSATAQKNTQREYILQPRRGDILDVKGNLLATSAFVKTVVADPTVIGNRQVEVARALAPLLDLNENELTNRLTPRLVRNPQGNMVTNKHVVLKTKVAPETWQKVQAAMASLSFGLNEKKLPQTEARFYRELRQGAVYVERLDDQLRDYPNRSLAAHVLGYVGAEDQNSHLTTGKYGIEYTFNKQLAGVRGWRVTEADQRNRELVPSREQDVEACDGLNVVLTIDSVLQSIVETALADAKDKSSPLNISGVMIRPRTGEVLALATLPNFDPNNPGQAAEEARKNRVIADIAEPGSTFKIVVVSGALNDGTVHLSDVFNCEDGHFLYAGKVLRDHGRGYGSLTVEQIITHSSNIGAAKIGMKMGETRLDEYIRSFGFGVATDICLPGEVSAKPFVPRVKDWSKLSIARIPMGQGISTTRLQMTMAMCAIANKGVLMRPMLVDRLQDREGNVVAKYSPQRIRQVISEATAKQMVTALKTVVSPEGTAPKAAVEHYTVAGKTGTAQKSGGKLGYLEGKYFSSFIGFFPADNPELCISITLDEPQKGHYGGDVAGPVFKQIAEAAARYLGIPPEEGETPTLATRSQ